MLADALRDIEDRLRREDSERARRAAVKAPLRQAEAYAHQLEELLLKGTLQVPSDLAAEIRLFVESHTPRESPRLSERIWAHAFLLLDHLFELQERIQSHATGPAGRQMAGA